MKGVKYDGEKPNLIPILEQVKQLYKKEQFYVSKQIQKIIISNNLNYSLIPSKAKDETTKVLMYGAVKYPSADNWKYVKHSKIRYTKALLRHICLWFLFGEKLDQESGYHHLSHACCCILFLLELDLEKIEKRNKK